MQESFLSVKAWFASNSPNIRMEHSARQQKALNMAMSIPRAHSVTQMMPADGWFFRFESAGQPKLLRLAAWGLDHDGRVVGMVSASTADFDYAHLVMVPSNVGVYLHQDDLQPQDKALLRSEDATLFDVVYK